MKHYWFIVVEEGHECEGEEFLVGANTLADAKKYAATIFEGNPALRCYGRVSDYEAECLGLDEY